MTPIEKAKELCAKKNIVFEKHFCEFIAAPMHVIISTPENFGMARAVKFSDNREAWLVGLVVGNLRELVKQLPFELPFIAFYRSKNGKDRVYNARNFLAKLTSHKSQVTCHRGEQ